VNSRPPGTDEKKSSIPSETLAPPGRERRVEKRKLEGGESILPPIKLKLSLKPAADTSADSEYKVKTTLFMV
jgi:hypothetical protein